MFDHLHYVPILRWKDAEKKSLLWLNDDARKRTTPLLEITYRGLSQETGSNDHRLVDLLENTARTIRTNWCYAPVFVDIEILMQRVRLNSGKHPFEILGEHAKTSLNNLKLIPVTYLDSNNSHQYAVKSIASTFGLGICLRLTMNDLQKPRFAQDIESLLRYHNLNASDVNLVIDFKLIGEFNPTFIQLNDIIPFIREWRSFTVVSGAFPKDLSDLSGIGEHQLPRRDWTNWLDQIRNSEEIVRIPSYGDYTIQHPYYIEHEGYCNPSASIRYAGEEAWIIMRGEGLISEGSPGYQQYIGNAQLLCGNSEYQGPKFSYGDEYIQTIANGSGKTGNTTTWLTAGINHHITLVAEYISRIPKADSVERQRTKSLQSTRQTRVQLLP